MRFVGSLAALAACRIGFDATGMESAGGDGAVLADGLEGDGTPGDAPACVAPAGCVAFTCSGSSACYAHCATPTTWQAAADQCAAVGSCLVTLIDTTESACLSNKLANASFAWIGYYQPTGGPEPDAGWAWLCGASSLVFWGGGNPSDPLGDQDCAVVSSGTGWADMSCTQAFASFCKAP
jgi:hypothetical protein